MAGGKVLAQIQDALVEMAIAQARELARMRALGMKVVAGLERRVFGKMSPQDAAAYDKNSKGVCFDFAMVVRAIRQIHVLEREVLGLTEARRRPDDWETPERYEEPVRRGRRWKDYAERDDIQDYYDTQPMGRTVDWIRETLAIEPPPGDAFEDISPRAKRERIAEEGPAEPAEDTPAEDGFFKPPTLKQWRQIHEDAWAAIEAARRPTEEAATPPPERPPRGPPD